MYSPTNCSGIREMPWFKIDLIDRIFFQQSRVGMNDKGIVDELTASFLLRPVKKGNKFFGVVKWQSGYHNVINELNKNCDASMRPSNTSMTL